MSFGKPKKIAPPELPEPVPAITEIAPEAMKAGQAERRRLRGRKGRAATIFAGRGPIGPATVQQAGLLTKLGGRS